MRRFLSEYAFILAVFAASIGGHYWFVFVHRPQLKTMHIQMSDQAGVTRVAVQIVAARPKPKLELTEPVTEIKPIETPEPMEVQPAKVDIPPEKTIAAEIPRPTAPPAPPPPPPIEKVEEQEKPPEEKPPEPPRRRKPKPAEIQQDRPEIQSVNDQTVYQEAKRGSDVKVSAQNFPRPNYPPDLLLKGIEGDLDLAVKIDETGKVVSVAVLRSSGHAAMDRNAVDVVSRQWRFNPPTRDGRPVAEEVKIPMLYSIGKSRRTR